MKTFRSFLTEVDISAEAIKKMPPLTQTKVSDLETHYTKPLTDRHSLVVMFSPPKYDVGDVAEVNWKFHGSEHFPPEKYTSSMHRDIITSVAKAIHQHTQVNPNIKTITGFAMTPGLDRSYGKILSSYATTHGGKYSTSKTPFSSVFGTHQHTLVLPQNNSK